MPAFRARRAAAKPWATLALAFLAARALTAGAAHAQCLPDPPMAGDTVTCSGVLTEGFRVPAGIDNVTVFVDPGTLITSIGDGVRVNQNSTIENHGTVTVNGVGSAGLAADAGLSTDRTSVTNAADGAVVVSADQAIGLAAGTRADVRNDGTITVQGTASTAVSINGSSAGPQSTVVNGATGSIVLDGDQSVGLFSGSRVLVTNDGSITGSGAEATGIRATQQSSVDQSGTITLSGDDARGIGAGQAARAQNSGTITMSGANAVGIFGQDGSSPSLTFRTQIENTTSGVVVVTGDAAVGMSVGTLGLMQSFGQLDAQGTGAIGMQAGLDSVVENGGLLTVSGTDAVGIDSEQFSPGLPPLTGATYYNVWNRFDAAAGVAGRIVSANPDAGPLVQLQSRTPGRVNRVRNDAGAEMRADLTNLGTPGRGVAVQGSVGADEVVNAGIIEGRVDLDFGDDVYTHVAGATLVDVGPGHLDGGPGSDEIHLSSELPQLGEFAPDFAQNFEMLRVQGYWRLTAPTPAGLDVMVDPGGRFRVAEPTRIESDFAFTTPLAGQSGGTLEAAIGAATAALPELLSVGGTATLDAGVLDVSVDNRFAGTTTVTVLRADTELVGRFASVAVPTDPGLALGPVVYDDTANTVSLSVSALPFAANQAATAAYLDRVEAGGPAPALQSIIDGLNGLDYSSYRQALDQLHPEAFDAHTATTLQLAHRYTQLMLERPRYCIAARGRRREDPKTRLPCRERRLEPWAAVYGQLGDRTGETGHIGWSNQGAGLVLGLDHRMSDGLLFSGTVGAAYDSLDVDGIGKGRIKTLDLGVYAGYTRGRTRVQGVASYGRGWQTQFRNLRLPGFARTAEAAWDTNRIGIRLEADHVVGLGAWDIAPLASIDYSAMLQNAFAETGAAPVSLAVDAQTDNVVTLRAGFELTTALHKRDYWTELLETADGVWRPALSVRWRQVVTGYDRPITARFVGDPAGVAAPLTVAGNAPNKGFEIGAGIDWTPRMADRLTVGIRYDVFVWSDVTSHDLVARVRLGF